MTTGFDQHDLEHMDSPGFRVQVAYTVTNESGRVMHATDFTVSGPEFAAALRSVADEVTA